MGGWDRGRDVQSSISTIRMVLNWLIDLRKEGLRVVTYAVKAEGGHNRATTPEFSLERNAV